MLRAATTTSHETERDDQGRIRRQLLIRGLLPAGPLRLHHAPRPANPVHLRVASGCTAQPDVTVRKCGGLAWTGDGWSSKYTAGVAWLRLSQGHGNPQVEEAVFRQGFCIAMHSSGGRHTGSAWMRWSGPARRLRDLKVGTMGPPADSFMVEPYRDRPSHTRRADHIRRRVVIT
jgi:hypothetical protein